MYKQEPNSKNCMQCAVAYMFGLKMEEVPNFVDAPSAEEAWDCFLEFIKTQGHYAVLKAGNHQFEGDYLASGVTKRGTHHMVVMNDGRLVHDPHPDNTGLSKVEAVWLIARNATPLTS